MLDVQIKFKIAATYTSINGKTSNTTNNNSEDDDDDSVSNP